jgi:CheY-like chemotaxis protein
MSQLQVLLVEDDPDSAAVAQMLLNSAGIQTTLAASAEIALTQLRLAPSTYSAVIADLALPEMDGMELLAVVRKEGSFGGLKLIAMTAYHTPELKVKLLDAGIDAYFAKPLDTVGFIKTLKQILVA